MQGKGHACIGGLGRWASKLRLRSMPPVTRNSTACRRLALKRPMAIEHAARAEPATLMAFDLLWLDGKDMRGMPLLKRKATLKKLLRGFERIRYVEHIGEEGVRFFEQTEKLGLEGIVAKRADAAYPHGRSPNWVKVKTSAGRAIDEERAKWSERR